MRITWVTRSFLDYRIPVFQVLDEMCGHQLTVIYYKDIPPIRCQEKIKSLLGERAIGRETEFRIGNRPKIDNASRANTSIRIPISFGLIRQLISTKPEVLISDGFMQWTYAPLIVRAIKGIPHVMLYERTAYTERSAGKMRTFYRKFVSRWIDAIGCNGSLTGDYIKSLLGWDDHRLTYGHMVADVSGLKNTLMSLSDEAVLNLRKKHDINGVMILYVGQLIPRKGVLELLYAWESFIKNVSKDSATLVYVGAGPLYDELQLRVQTREIANVKVIGAVDYDSIALYYKASNCLIIPTLEDNWSLVVPEAMACGLPIATSIYNGCHPELVHLENGWIFDPNDKNSIESVLLDIIKKKDLLSQMGEKSVQIVATETAERAANSIMSAVNIAKKHVAK